MYDTVNQRSLETVRATQAELQDMAQRIAAIATGVVDSHIIVTNATITIRPNGDVRASATMRASRLVSEREVI